MGWYVWDGCCWGGEDLSKGDYYTAIIPLGIFGILPVGCGGGSGRTCMASVPKCWGAVFDFEIQPPGLRFLLNFVLGADDESNQIFPGI